MIASEWYSWNHFKWFELLIFLFKCLTWLGSPENNQIPKKQTIFACPGLGAHVLQLPGESACRPGRRRSTFVESFSVSEPKILSRKPICPGLCALIKLICTVLGLLLFQSLEFPDHIRHTGECSGAGRTNCCLFTNCLGESDCLNMHVIALLCAADTKWKQWSRLGKPGYRNLASDGSPTCKPCNLKAVTRSLSPKKTDNRQHFSQHLSPAFEPSDSAD